VIRWQRERKGGEGISNCIHAYLAVSGNQSTISDLVVHNVLSDMFGPKVPVEDTDTHAGSCYNATKDSELHSKGIVSVAPMRS